MENVPTAAEALRLSSPTASRAAARRELELALLGLSTAEAIERACERGKTQAYVDVLFASVSTATVPEFMRRLQREGYVVTHKGASLFLDWSPA